jgi:hypothetical protein
MIDRKLVIIISLAVAAVIGLGIFGLLFANKDQSKQEETTYIDPGTGKEIVSGKPLTQTSADNPDPSRPTFIGFATLTDRGLSTAQRTKLENALYAYSSKNSLGFKEISLTVNSIETTPPGSTEPGYYMYFNITVNRSKQYHIKVTYNDFISCVTRIFESDKTTLLFTQ